MLVHYWRLRQNQLGEAITDLNFQTPETVSSWYCRWADEIGALTRPSFSLHFIIALKSLNLTVMGWIYKKNRQATGRI